MAFPTSPTNGQQANINGITYTYSSALTAWTVSTSVSNSFVSINVSANVNSGNVLATGVISATGNITGGNVLGGANVNATTHTGTTVSVTANVTGGNILTAGLISATGNITGGNLSVTGSLNATKSGGTLSILTQTSATGYGLTIVPGADTVYDAFTINNASNTLNKIRMFGDGSASFGGNLLVGDTTTIGTGGAFQAKSSTDTSIFKCTSATTYAAIVSNVENTAARLIAFQYGSGASPTNVGRITTDGTNIAIATVSGITFPATQSASADANTLDDYEEGTFDPTITRSGSNPTVTYTNQLGSYVKVGRLVSVTLGLSWSANSGGSGNFTISGLPFTNTNSADNYSQAFAVDISGITFAAGTTTLGGYVNVNTTTIFLTCAGSAVSSSAPTLGSSGYLYMSVTYMASA